MKLTLNGIKEHEAWENAGIQLPGYDVEKISAKAKEAPVWVHFGIGNIFRVFIGGIADGLLEEGILDRGITCVETFDYDVVDKIYEPYDNLGLNVILHGDGNREYKVLGALAEAVKAQSSDLEQWNRLKEIFTSKSLQMASFTITEKGYALHKADGTWFPFVQADIQNGPDKATGAMAALLKDAIKPNLVQTLEHTPAIVHGGPFANIAHGCNSVRATKMALKLSDITITEAGFGADLGAEKFFDIKCRMADVKPDAVVLVATVRALKYNGGVAKADLAEENLDALAKGIVNLEKHIENIQKYKVPVIVTLNSFVTDTDAENEFIRRFCEERGCEFALSEVWEKGGEGGIALAEKVLDTLENKKSDFELLYEDSLSLEEKIEKIAKEIYGADGVVYEPAAKKQIAKIESLGFGSFPVCMAKNQYSLSDDAKKLGRPHGFDIHIREVYVSAGAGFVVALTGAVMTMPGLPKVPAANGIDVTEDGTITGLF